MATKYVSLESLKLYDGLIKDYINTADAKAFKSAKFDETTRVLSLYKVETPADDAVADFTVTIPKTDISGLLEKLTTTNVGNVVVTKADGTIEDGGVALSDLATDAELKTVSDKADANATAIETINNVETGILKQAKDYADEKVQTLTDGAVKDNADDIAALDAKVGAVPEGKTVIGIIDEIQENAYDDTELQGKIGDLTTLKTEVKSDLVAAVNEVHDEVDGLATSSKVTVTTDTTTEGYLKTYTIKQGDTEIGKVDIPKDLFAVSGSVVKDPDGQPAGTYVELVIQNQEEPIYIDVASLIDNYTVEADATQIQLAIDNDTRKISATIVAGSVNTTELADNAVTTAKITDGNVTLAKLADDAKNAFDSAGSAKAAETNAKNYVGTIPEGSTATTAIGYIQELVGTEKMEAVTEDDINSLFATV